MKDVRFQNFNYDAIHSLPAGVVFFGTDGSGVFHQMTRNSDPSSTDTALPQAVDDTIELAKTLADEGTSVGFEPADYHVANGHVYARAGSMLSSGGGLSFAENIFFFDDDNYLVQIQCGSLLTPPSSAIGTREQIQARIDEMIDAVIAAGFSE